MISLDDRIPRVALVVYVLAVLFLVFQPTPAVASGSVSGLTDWLRGFGVADGLINGYRVEFVLNTIMFIPLPVLGSLLWRRVRWSEWVVLAFVASTLIELTQAFFLENRSATFVDIVSNTLGGLLGGLIGLVACRFISLREPIRG